VYTADALVLSSLLPFVLLDPLLYSRSVCCVFVCVCVHSGHCYAAREHDAWVLRVSTALHCTAIPEDRRGEERVELRVEEGRDWDLAAVMQRVV
jgi:hypothetical protein